MMIQIAAFAISLAAVGCVFRSWQQRGQAMLALLGWSLAALSVAFWSWAQGGEFGVTYATIVFVCLVWVNIAIRMEASTVSTSGTTRPFRAIAFPNLTSIGKQLALFAMSVPVMGVLALWLTVALVIFLPWTLLTEVAVAIFLYPVLWGALAAWVCVQNNLLRPAIVTVSLFIITSLLLFI